MLKGGGYVLMLCAVAAVALVGMLRLPWEQFAPGMYEASAQPVYPGRGAPIQGAVFAGDRLWIRTGSGELWTVRPGAPGARKIPAPDGVVDLCAYGGDVVIATSRPASAPTWTLRRWTGSDWSTLMRVASGGEGLVGITCEPEGINVLTARRLITLRGARRTELVLSQRVPSLIGRALLETPQALFVGLHAGEFGGALMRVDRRSGEVASIRSNVSGDLCGGPLNPDCDPVTGLAPDPWRPDCIAAAIGLWGRRGRVLEVCGDRVTRLYFQPHCPDTPDNPPVNQIAPRRSAASPAWETCC